MQVTMMYFAHVRHAAGVEKETVDVPSGDLKAALDDAARRHGAAFRALVVDDERNIRPGLLVLVNGMPVSRETPPPMKDGDAVSLMSAIAGG